LKNSILSPESIYGGSGKGFGIPGGLELTFVAAGIPYLFLT